MCSVFRRFRFACWVLLAWFSLYAFIAIAVFVYIFHMNFIPPYPIPSCFIHIFGICTEYKSYKSERARHNKSMWTRNVNQYILIMRMDSDVLVPQVAIKFGIRCGSYDMQRILTTLHILWVYVFLLHSLQSK